ncbi:hypothetical protein NUU61_009126 [Penicillium alfredii]|uniref:Acyl-coenzyme A diphosphatase SCS3 n=1 Tax=Penicillium alfredii TaxID=1506179 RepID=A0A9W9EMJ8_9EURO|nr:uncharacterized protein NUU61_009126 [Penicillium alfredii]KAJ5084547.1 hypothetical protein NUU61_009126 [Penicillium alfredii]
MLTSARDFDSLFVSVTMATRPATLSPAVLVVYPATLVLGSLFSVISPTARATRQPSYSSQTPDPLSPSVHSDIHHSDSPVNYFARKNNVFNVYFVKVGWLWTTLAFASLLLFQPAYRSSQSSRQSPQSQQQQPIRLRRYLQAFLRYALATAVWYLMTQWFFGPPVIDRSFMVTGGKCEQALGQVKKIGAESGSPSAQLETLFTAAACKAAGGAWRGGHDISGHVLMLILATASLAFEAVGAGASPFSVRSGRPIGEGGRERKASDPEAPWTGESNGTEGVARTWSARLVWGVVVLGWWMLFMTAIWFHTWFEKWTGLSVALGAVYAIYILPRKVPAWRDIVGVPGV